MSLQTSGSVQVKVDRATAYQFVANPAQLAMCIPGCRELRELSPGRYSAELSSKVAYITLKFRVISEIVRMEAPRVLDVKLAGDSIGLAGRVSATASLELTETATAGTEIRYLADVVLTGKLGGLGEPVFRSKSLELARQFAENLKAAIETAPAAAGTASA